MEDGDLSAWNRGLTPATSAVHVGAVKGGVLKGLALLPSTAYGPEILVADFAHGRIAAFDRAFQRIALPRWAFTDRRIPRGYAPFNVALLGSRVFVTYAKQDAAKHDDVAGAGHGFVDVYSTGGRLLDRFARRGVLNSRGGSRDRSRDFRPSRAPSWWATSGTGGSTPSTRGRGGCWGRCGTATAGRS